MSKDRTNGLPGILFSGILLVLGLSSLWIAYAATSNDAEPVVAAAVPIIPPAAKGEQCVADTDLMRTDHMVFLNHQRDSTVIDGVRGEPFSLVGCVDCHAQTTVEGKPVRIDAEGQFCESCHSYAAVKIDCFTCHAAVPEQDKVIGLKLESKINSKTDTANVEQLDQYLAAREEMGIPGSLHNRQAYFAKHHGKQN